MFVDLSVPSPICIFRDSDQDREESQIESFAHFYGAAALHDRTTFCLCKGKDIQALNE